MLSPRKTADLALHGEYGDEAAQQDIIKFTMRKELYGDLGVSFGGGSPFCPCVYITQLHRKDFPESVECGDEIIALGQATCIGKTLKEIYALIYDAGEEIEVVVRKLIKRRPGIKFDSLSFSMRKLTQKLTSQVSADTLNFFGFRRAVLQEDPSSEFSSRIEKFEKSFTMYEALIAHAKAYIKHIKFAADAQSDLGHMFEEMAAKENDPPLVNRLRAIGDSHIRIGKFKERFLSQAEKSIDNWQTFLTKALPDAKSTQLKYDDARCSYLAHFVKLHDLATVQARAEAEKEALPEVLTGNYEFRLVLRDSMRAHVVFERSRKDLLEKLELLDTKHVHDMSEKLTQLTLQLAEFHDSVTAACLHADEALDTCDQ